MGVLFSDSVVGWFHEHGRKHLPWQQNPGPYEVWVSEIMLQQTQVATVIDYYQRFMARFPDVHTLASASIDDVLHYWAGLGYYARGRNLHKTAIIVSEEHAGLFPDTVEGLEALPGIGRSTAGAIVSLGYHKPAVILDGNVKRVLARVHAIDTWPGETKTHQRLWALAAASTPQEQVQAYNQAMMDLGAMICTRTKPLCERCPLTAHCASYANDITHSIPVPKPSKALPTREGAMVILMREDGAVLLQQRSSPGIWGGLWCYPEKSEIELNDFVVSFSSSLEKSRHIFTHFRWELALEFMKVDNLEVNKPDYVWYNAGTQPLGLAIIVKKTLPTILEQA